jgi:hypothetical protein
MSHLSGNEPGVREIVPSEEVEETENTLDGIANFLTRAIRNRNAGGEKTAEQVERENARVRSLRKRLIRIALKYAQLTYYSGVNP